MKQKQKPLSFSLHPDNHAYIEALVTKEKLVNSRYSRSVYMDDLITLQRLKSTKPKAKVLTVDDEIPEGLNTGAWAMWMEFRRKAKFKSYKTTSAAKKLAKMGTYDEQVLIVQQSIDNEYQGLFALKGNNNGHQSASKKESSHERIKRENAVKYGGQDESGLRVAGTVGHLGGAVDSGEGIRTIESVDNEPFVDY